MTITRFIGAKKYKIQRVIDKDSNVQETITTDMNGEEIARFKAEWEEKWDDCFHVPLSPIRMPMLARLENNSNFE